MDFTATRTPDSSEVISDYRHSRVRQLRAWFRGLRKSSADRYGPCGCPWGTSCRQSVQAVAGRLDFVRQFRSTNLVRLTQFKEYSCLAASPRANPPRLAVRKARRKCRHAKNQASLGRPTPARAPVRRGPVAQTTARGKGYNPIAPERISEILKRLDTLYPDVTCALTTTAPGSCWSRPFSPRNRPTCNVNLVTPELFRKYPTVQDFAALNPEQLEPDVRSTGFFRNKSKSVVGAAKKIVDRFRRPGSRRDGSAAHPARRRAQDRERRAGHVVQESRRRGRRHARTPHLAPPGTHAATTTPRRSSRT